MTKPGEPIVFDSPMLPMNQPVNAVDGDGNTVPNLHHKPETVLELIAQWREFARRWRLHAAGGECREHFIDKAEDMERLAADVERVYLSETKKL